MRSTTALALLFATFLVSYVSSQEYWIYETYEPAPLRDLDEAPTAADDPADHGAVSHTERVVSTTVTRTRVCGVVDPETGELSKRPLEECRQNNAEEIPPPEGGDEQPVVPPAEEGELEPPK